MAELFNGTTTYQDFAGTSPITVNVGTRTGTNLTVKDYDIDTLGGVPALFAFLTCWFNSFSDPLCNPE